MSVRTVVASLLLSCLLLGVTSVGEAQRRRRRRARGPGQLTLITTVDGAEVLIDEDSVGFTPVEPIELEPGSHTVRLRRPGYTEFDEVVEIRAGQNTDLEAGMIALSMVLTVRSDPDEARVFVDEAFRGTTPLELELNEGEHEIRVVAPRYREQTQTVNAIAGETNLISVELERIPDELLNPRALEWYEEPLTWGLIAGGVAVLAAGLSVILYFALRQDPVTAFCASQEDPNCFIHIMDGQIEWRDAWTAAAVTIPME